MIITSRSYFEGLPQAPKYDVGLPLTLEVQPDLLRLFLPLTLEKLLLVPHLIEFQNQGLVQCLEVRLLRFALLQLQNLFLPNSHLPFKG